MAEDKESCKPEGLPGATVLAAELLGNFFAAKMPANLQTLIGNWLLLVGQLLLVFSAQQEFCQSTHANNHAISDDGRSASNTQPDVQQLQQEIAQLQQRLKQMEDLLQV